MKRRTPKAAALRSLGRWDEAIDSSLKAIAMFETAGAVAKMAEASLSLAMIHTWRLEFAAVDRTIERALECLGSAEPGLRLGLLGRVPLHGLLYNPAGLLYNPAGLLSE